MPSIKTVDAFLPHGKEYRERYAQSSPVDFHSRPDNHERRLAVYLSENIRYQHMRLEPSYYAVKQELEPLTVSVKRTGPSAVVANKDVDDTKHWLETWATNLSLKDTKARIDVRAYDTETGRKIHDSTIVNDATLEQNQSTEITRIEVPQDGNLGGREGRTVVAVYLFEGNKQLARHINWPEPLKYVYLSSPKNLQVQAIQSEAVVEISSDVPIKGMFLESEDDDVFLKDNGVDIVPGEIIRLKAKGLKGEDDLKIAYYQ